MRPLDHLVLPVVDLEAERDLYARLGFTTAPKGVHPFGTANYCIFLQDGTFLEPLVFEDIAKRDGYMSGGTGSGFVETNSSFRAHNPAGGFSHLVLRTNDAHGDMDLFEHAGYGMSPTFFERQFSNGEGDEQRVRFSLAFAKDHESPNAHFFACQSHIPVQIDVSHLRQHSNGVTGIKAVYGLSNEPHKHKGFADCFTGVAGQKTDGCLIYDLGTATWKIVTPDVMPSSKSVASTGISHHAIEFQTPDLRKTAEYLSDASFELSEIEKPRQVHLPMAGFDFIFSEA